MGRFNAAGVSAASGFLACCPSFSHPLLRSWIRRQRFADKEVEGVAFPSSSDHSNAGQREEEGHAEEVKELAATRILFAADFFSFGGRGRPYIF